jgi:membrane protein
VTAGPAPDRRPRARERARWVGRRLVEEWTHDRVPDTAAAVAFWAVLSLLPAFLTVASLLGPLDSLLGGELAQDVQDEVLGFLGRILTDEAGGTIDTARSLFEDERPGLLTFSLLAAIWTVSRAFAALVRALDVAYDVVERRSWLRIRAIGLAVAVGTLLAATLLLVVLVLGPLFGTGEEIAAEIGLGDQFVFLWNVVRLPFAFVVLVLWAATVFHVSPDHRSSWRSDLPGAFVTAALWLVFSAGLRIYLELAQAGNAVFGALGGALIVLLWFWLLSLAILIGAELNFVLAEERARWRGSAGVEGVAEATDEVAGVDCGAAVEQHAHDGRGHDDPVGGSRGGDRRLG